MERMTPYMKKDAYGEYTICNIYYDTDDYRLIRASLEKPVYKEKLRVRSYGVPQEDGKVFVELKKKFDGVVYKRRITTGIQNMDRFSPVSCRVKTSARSDARSAIFSRFITPRPRSSSATTGSPLRALTIRSSASRSTRTYGGATRMSTSASQPRCTHRAALRRCADGGQDSRRVPAVALPSTLRRRGVLRVVFQIRCLLP